MSSYLIIIFLIIAVFFLLYKYNKIEKKTKVIKVPVPIKPKRNNYMAKRDVMPHMTYSAGPFDESMWRYPEIGGKTIISQAANPQGYIPLGRTLVPNSRRSHYIGKYPYYHHEFNSLFY